MTWPVHGHDSSRAACPKPASLAQALQSSLNAVQTWLWLGQWVLSVPSLTYVFFTIWRLLCLLQEISQVLAANAPQRQLMLLMFWASPECAWGAQFPTVICFCPVFLMILNTLGWLGAGTPQALSCKLISSMLAPRWSIWACIWKNSTKVMFSYYPEAVLQLQKWIEPKLFGCPDDSMDVYLYRYLIITHPWNTAPSLMKNRVFPLGTRHNNTISSNKGNPSGIGLSFKNCHTFYTHLLYIVLSRLKHWTLFAVLDRLAE